MKKVFLLVSLSALILSCGDAGFQLNVSKRVEFIFDVQGEDLTFDANGVASYSDQTEITMADELSDFLDNLDGLEINEISMRYVDFDGDANFNLGVGGDNNIGSINDVSGPILNNESLFIHPGGRDAAVTQIESLIMNGSNFNLLLDATFDGDVDINGFQIIYVFDVTGKIGERN